jgi:hypothetical protein
MEEFRPPQNLYVKTLTLTVMLFGNGSCKRYLGIDGVISAVLTVRLNGLIGRRRYSLSLSFLHPSLFSSPSLMLLLPLFHIHEYSK